MQANDLTTSAGARERPPEDTREVAARPSWLDYILLFCRLRQQQPFSSTTADLYHHLLYRANSLGWKNPFQEGNPIIMATLGMSDKTLMSAREKLVAAGLLRFTAGKKGCYSTYELLYPENNTENVRGIREQSGSNAGAIREQPGGNPPSNNRYRNKSKNKEANASRASEQFSEKGDVPANSKKAAGKAGKTTATAADIAALALPHLGSEFAEAWHTFATTNTKQTGKPLTAFELMLKKLGKYPAGFAVVMLEAAIQGNWSGVENSGTTRAFVEWQAEQDRQPTSRPQPQPPPVGPAPTTTPALNSEVTDQRQAQRDAEAAAARRRVRNSAQNA